MRLYTYIHMITLIEINSYVIIMILFLECTQIRESIRVARCQISEITLLKRKDYVNYFAKIGRVDGSNAPNFKISHCSSNASSSSI